MWENDLDRMVAVTPERIYSLGRLPGGLFLDPGEIRQEYAAALERVQARLIAMADIGSISRAEAESRGRWADEVMDELGVFYDYQLLEVEP